MKSLKHLTPWFAAVAIGGAVALAPVAAAATPASPAATTSAIVAAAGTDPLVPYGTDPQPRTRLGYVDSNHDEINTSNGEVDVPF